MEYKDIEDFCIKQRSFQQRRKEIQENKDQQQEKVLKAQFSLELKRFEVQRRKFLSQTFHRLKPKLAKPRNYVWKEVQAEYESLLNEVTLEYCEKICQEFEHNPNLPLEESLIIWINRKLRLEYRVIDLTSPKIKFKERLFQVLVDMIQNGDREITALEFAEQVVITSDRSSRKLSNYTTIEASAFLQQKVEEYGGRTRFDQQRNSTIYCFESNQVYFTPQETLQQEQRRSPRSLNEPVSTQSSLSLEDTLASLENDSELVQSARRETYLTIQKRIEDAIATDPRFETCHLKLKPKCTCRLLLQKILSQKRPSEDQPVDDVTRGIQFLDANTKPKIGKGNLKPIVQELRLEYKRVSSFIDRSCFPLVHQIVIESFVQNKLNQNKLRRYIEGDSNHVLRNCKFEPCLNCDCQFLAQQLLDCFQDPPATMKAVANAQNLESPQVRRKLKEHWEQRCLFLISKIVFALEIQNNEPE